MEAEEHFHMFFWLEGEFTSKVVSVVTSFPLIVRGNVYDDSPLVVMLAAENYLSNEGNGTSKIWSACYKKKQTSKYVEL